MSPSMNFTKHDYWLFYLRRERIMLQRYCQLLDRRGNVTTFWLVGIAIFFFVFAVLGTVVVAWMQHAYAQAVADSGSLAATKKMDQWVQEEMNRKLQEAWNIDPDGDPYDMVLGTEEKKNAFMREVINRHRGELQAVVRKYVTKNGGSRHGTIRLPVNKRIEVEAQLKFEPMIFHDFFEGTFVKGSGTGPSREYLTWLKSDVVINY